MNADKVYSPMLLLVLVFAASYEALDADQSCNVTQVRHCYSSLLDSLVAELSQQQPDPSLHENLCKKYGATSQCEADVEACLTSFPAVKDLERLYSIIRREACGDPTFTLLRSNCTPLPLIVSCIQSRQLQVDNSTEGKKAVCNELEAGLHSCLIAPDVQCPKHRRRAAYGRKTMATMMKIRGCDAGDGSPSAQQDGRTQSGPAGVQEVTHGEKCWYKQAKRCNEKQINDIRTRSIKFLKKNFVLKDNFYAGLCRKTREICYQHTTIDPCAAHKKEVIRRLEEAMNEAQALLCKDDRALLKNLVHSFMWWNITQFTKCSTDMQVKSITDFLYSRPRVHRDCRLLKSRVFTCLDESYATAGDVDPKPDVQGARNLLAVFLDRMTCVDDTDPSLVGDGTSGPADTGDPDYPGDEVASNATEAEGSAMPIISDVGSGAAATVVRKSAIAGFVLLMVLPWYFTQS